MRVGWLADQTTDMGGAELTQAEFRAGAPDDVEIVDCAPGHVEPGLDRYVIHNCVQYSPDDTARIDGPAVKYWHDVGPWVNNDVRAWISEHARQICCSPVQADHMGLEAHLIPPPVDLDRFTKAAENVNGDRAGAVCVGSWFNHGKAPHKVAEWAVQNDQGIDFYGTGPLSPPGCQHVAYDAMPALLAGYETFVFLPTALEPFGRLVCEAWAAGCKVVTNRLVGARYWIEGRADAIETASEDFWKTVLA